MNGRIENDLKIYKNIEEQLYEYPEYITDWYFYLKANNQSATTCRDYINKIKQFLLSINNNIRLVKLNDINKNIVTKYFNKIQSKTNKDGDIIETSDSYKGCVWSCLNNFFSFLESREMINENYLITAKIKRPKNRDLQRINRNRKLLTQEDFHKILVAVEEGAGSNKAKGYQMKYKNRDKLIMLIFMTTGMRKTALEEINIDDVDLNNKTLSIIDKGHIVHKYYLNDMVVNTYNDWLIDRYNIMGNYNGALFISKEKKRMCGNSITKIVDKYAYEGLGYHISPHKLRSGLVSIVYDQTKDIEFCRRMIGHSNIATTQRYIVTNNQEREMTAEIMNNLLQ